MKRYLVAFIFAALAATGARAADAWTMDPATMTTNATFTFPSTSYIDTAGWQALACEVSVTEGDTRSIIPKCYTKAGTLVFTYPTMTVAGGAQGRYVFDPRTTAATADTGVTDSPNVPCRYLKLTAAAAGPGTVQCTLRKE